MAKILNMTSSIKSRIYQNNPLPNVGKVQAILLAGLIVTVIGFLTAVIPLEIPVIAVGGLLIAGILFFNYQLYQLAFIASGFILFAIFDFAGYVPVLSQPLKIYLADSITFLLIILFLRILFIKSFIQRLASPVSGLLVINFLFGFTTIIIGLAAGHLLNDVIGDFRRFFFYPLITLIPLSCLSRPTDIRKLIIPFSIALLIISGIAMMRVITGQTWDPEQFTRTGDFRAIGYFTGIIVLMGIGVFYGLSLISNKYQRWFFRITVGFLGGVILVSGYRLLWVMAIALPFFVSYSAFRGRKRILKLFSAIVLLPLLLIGSLFLVQLLFPDSYLLLIGKFQERVLDFSFKTNIRYYAWQAAWAKFVATPLTGVGIGDQFRFQALNSANNFYISNLTTHNIFLSLLYQTGVIGGGLFIIIHFQVIWYVWRRLPRLEPHIRLPVAGMLGSYLAALAMAMFQPLLESPGPVVGFYLWIGLMITIVQIYIKSEPAVSRFQKGQSDPTISNIGEKI